MTWKNFDETQKNFWRFFDGILKTLLKKYERTESQMKLNLDGFSLQRPSKTEPTLILRPY